MMSEPAREPSMEDILASIKKVIAEEQEEPARAEGQAGDDVLELQELADAGAAEPADLGPPLLSDGVAKASRQSLANLQQVAATSPQPAMNPLEAMIREMLRPVLKEWLEKNLPEIVEEHVRREIMRITGTPL